MKDREARLVEASRWALRWFTNRLGGTALNGPNDDLLLARQLTDVLADYQDLPDPREPPHPIAH